MVLSLYQYRKQVIKMIDIFCVPTGCLISFARSNALLSTGNLPFIATLGDTVTQVFSEVTTSEVPLVSIWHWQPISSNAAVKSRKS